jgi:hypothetical protein
MAADNLGWVFPFDEADQWKGFNDPGIEHFRGNPLSSLAREIIQNSLDAAVRFPITVSFTLQQVPTAQVPGIQQLRSTTSLCLKNADSESKKAKEFFVAAEKLLAAKNIPVLSIVEKNTTGIRGPCRNGTPYFCYVKAMGQSKKEDSQVETGLGSYGIGKFAPFAASNLRTIFVSTVFQQGSGYQQYTQGKAVWMSHVDGNKTRQNIGYWGQRTNCMPLEGYKHDSVPSWLQRASAPTNAAQNTGTSLHVLGFMSTSQWEQLLIASVLENFFGAIWKSKLIVEVGEEVIAKESINELFSRPSIRDALAGTKGEPERFDSARNYLSALTATEEVFIENHENRELGNCEVRIIVAEEAPKRVAVLRNGMFITDRMDYLRRFGDFKEFAAVVECHSKKGNELLRDMEPPKHDDFEPERLGTNDQQRGQKALAELGKWVREMLKRHARDPVADVSEVKELADYFADDGQTGSGAGEDVNPIGKIQIRAQPLRRKSVMIREEQDGDDGGGDKQENGGGGGGGGGNGPGLGDGTGGRGQSSSRVIELSNVRSVRLTQSKRRVAITPNFTGKMEVVVYEAGADTDRRLDVLKSSLGKVRKGLIKDMPVKRGKRIAFDVELAGPFAGAMKVVGYEI